MHENFIFNTIKLCENTNILHSSSEVHASLCCLFTGSPNDICEAEVCFETPMNLALPQLKSLFV